VLCRCYLSHHHRHHLCQSGARWDRVHAPTAPTPASHAVMSCHVMYCNVTCVTSKKSAVRSFVRSFFRSFVCSFVRSFVRSFV
jgi:hypothetical protein